jgi:ribose transport system substrate-binding protein
MGRTTRALVLTALAVATIGVTSATAGQAGGHSVIFVGADLGDPFYQAMHCGAAAAAKKYGFTFSWTGTTSQDWRPELSIFNAAVERKPDGIVLAPFSPSAFIQPVRAAMKSMPVVTVDGNLSAKVELQNIRTNNTFAGGVAAKAMAKLAHGKGEVGVIGDTPDLPVEHDRITGFKHELAKYPGMKFVDVEYGQSSTAKAAQLVGAMIQRFPNLVGIYATDTKDAEGAGSAILSAGKRGKIKLVGYDAGPKEISGLKSGLFDALVGQSPYQEGYAAVTTLANYFSGKDRKPRYAATTGAGLITLANLNTAAAAKYVYKGCGA